MRTTDWQLTIIDAAPPNSDLGSLAAGDLDGDGHVELVVAGTPALSWYRPDTLESGVIDNGHVFQVGVTLADLDNDGVREIVIGDCDPPQHLFIFKPGATLDAPWRKIVVDATMAGSPHDVLVVDIDDDGELEIVANNIDAHPGLYIYKRATAALDGPWRKYAVQTGFFEEGLAVGDFDGDGAIEISAGPNLYRQPSAGPFAGPWIQQPLARDFREMCRNVAVDINGDGKPELVVIESEYMDGRLSWFEHDARSGWIEQRLPGRYVFGHSLDCRRDPVTNRVTIFVAEMAQGGWNPPYNWDARLLELISDDDGRMWRESLVFVGAGTHEAEACDIDNDGEVEYVGKECFRPKVQIYKRRRTAPLAMQHRMIDRDRAEPARALIACDVDGDGQADIVAGSVWYRAPDFTRHELPAGHHALAHHGGALISVAGVHAHRLTLRDGHWHIDALGALPSPHACAAITFDGAVLFGFGDGADPCVFEANGAESTLRGLGTVRAFASTAHGLVVGTHLCRREADGWRATRVIDGFDVARLVTVDVDGDGALEVVAGEWLLETATQVADPSARLAWFKPNDGDLARPWTMRVIDRLRCPHALGAADLDGDGVAELIAGEHDPFKPYRNRSRLIVYKRVDPHGRSWSPTVIDDRFEHFNAAQPLPLGDGRVGIASQGWTEPRYVHLWV
jgi:hypothetical protein